MKQLSITCSIDLFSSTDELPEQDRNLVKAAEKAIAGAYAPYSSFKVGAAVLLENGIVVTGNNQENAAYPSGLCAERVALFYASSQYPDQRIEAIAVSARWEKGTMDEPVTPCGACRQAISEYALKSGNPVRILMSSETGSVYRSASISDLLPLLFKLQPIG